MVLIMAIFVKVKRNRQKCAWNIIYTPFSWVYNSPLPPLQSMYNNKPWVVACDAEFDCNDCDTGSAAVLVISVCHNLFFWQRYILCLTNILLIIGCQKATLKQWCYIVLNMLQGQYRTPAWAKFFLFLSCYCWFSGFSCCGCAVMHQCLLKG